jgi:oligoribonuclease NrnB/cAMP/cGMP phosphodiesterase (DHH superfamily)
MKPSEVNCVITHGSCPDGWGAAWSAWRLLGHNAEYHFLNHGDPPPDVHGKNVLMVDFAYSKEEDGEGVRIMNDLNSQANDFLLLDHHAGAKEVLDGNIECKYIFDMGKSGAMLAWKFFHPEADVPPMILYIQDRDIWKWRLPDTKEYLACFDSYETSFAKMDEFYETPISAMVAEGRPIVRYQQALVHDLVMKAKEAYLQCPDGSQVLAMVVNSSSRQLNSDIGNQICSDIHIAAVWSFDHRTNNICVSLRSNGRINCFEIAQKFGGGGHKAASGFSYEGSIKRLFKK